MSWQNCTDSVSHEDDHQYGSNEGSHVFSATRPRLEPGREAAFSATHHAESNNHPRQGKPAVEKVRRKQAHTLLVR